MLVTSIHVDANEQKPKIFKVTHSRDGDR